MTVSPGGYRARCRDHGDLAPIWPDRLRDRMPGRAKVGRRRRPTTPWRWPVSTCARGRPPTGACSHAYLDGLRRGADDPVHLRFHDPVVPHTVVAVDSGVLCGFATTGRCEDPETHGAGELQALYVDPSSWGAGIGRTLMEEAGDDWDSWASPLPCCGSCWGMSGRDASTVSTGGREVATRSSGA